jgi:hypothetical protein
MSVEQKIKDLLARTGAKQIDEAAAGSGAVAGDASPPMQGSSQKASYQSIGTPNSVNVASVSKDSTVKTSVSGDATNPMQGSSQKATYDERDEDEENQGAKAAAPVKPNNLRARGAGAAPNYTTVGDPTSVVNMQKSSGNIAKEDTDVDGEQISEKSFVDVRSELNLIFGEDLSEEFRDKATSIFEAAVIARVNSEMERISEKLQEQKEAEVAEVAEALVDKVDSFLNYVVEQWMEENELAVEKGLRSEIAEDFIGGLKTLFQEHYIEVPEEKYNVLEELQDKASELEVKLNEAVGTNIDLNEQIAEMKKQQIISEMTSDLAATESEKLAALLEGVGFDSEKLYREKVKVVKENYFPKAAKFSPEEQILSEEAPLQSTDTISKYAQALSRAVKTR